jgi:heat induced stress protein YflT
MAKLVDTRIVTEAATLVGVFDSEVAARKAIAALERAGMPPDRIGIVADNVRQAREVAGSYSPQGALAGAMLGALLVAGFVVFGGETMRSNPVAIAMGGFAIVGGLAFIGWLAGRARVFKEDEYAEVENEVEEGEVLVSVVCDMPEGADTTRALLERAGAREVKIEESAEGV